MPRRLLLAVVAACLIAACGSDEPEDGVSGAVAGAVAEQLRYVDPQSSAVVAV
jgi:hypothetical protein